MSRRAVRAKSPRGGALLRRVGLLAVLSLAPLVLVAAAFALYVYAGVRAGGDAPVGTLAGLGVSAPVRIERDARGIPHVRARNERDLFFAEGYLQGVDRRFQLDIYERAVAGRLSEILGSSTLEADAAARTCDVRAIARAQLALLPASERANLDAFANGVNAATRTRPLAPEFRVLAYRPDAWTAEDSLVSSFATVLALTDTWDDVASRVAVASAVGPNAANAFFGITDPAYDAPTTGGRPAPVATLPPLGAIPYPAATPLGRVALDARAGSGSNDFVAGAALTSTRRALLANDPHLELRIPGVWWLVDLEAPGIHVAGATFAGVPGVILGHNAHLAWGATNGTVATVSVYRERFKSATSDEYLANGAWRRAEHRSETIGVRLGAPVVRDY
ncbi:MAG: penicillin acylase family protein, partial [Candidatus Eremiobacteraeota bacterium]|nr:penicillin acylase family protein [Candidatus Eremiobacteraeota bacterium]